MIRLDSRFLTRPYWENRVLRMFDSWRTQAAWDGVDTKHHVHDFAGFVGRKYAVMVSYRKNGEGVPSALWFALENGSAYVRTGADSPKVRRIKRNPQVLFAPSTVRATPVGPPVLCTVRILGPDESQHAQALLVRAYGLGRKLYDQTVARVYEDSAFLEITPMTSCDLCS